MTTATKSKTDKKKHYAKREVFSSSNIMNTLEAAEAVRKASSAQVIKDFWSKTDKHATIEADPTRRYSSGFKAIDDIFTSLGNSGLAAGIYLLVGDPGSGKSSFALQIMHNLISNGHKGAYLAYEGKNNIYECVRRLGLSEIIPIVDQTDGWSPNSDSICQMLVDGSAANQTGKPAVFCIDSIKNLNAGEGSIKGRRTAIQELLKTVTRTNSIVFLIGHVSKETRGKVVKKIQGPSELEELCDVRMDFINLAETGARAKKKAKPSVQYELAKMFEYYFTEPEHAPALAAAWTLANDILMGKFPRTGAFEHELNSAILDGGVDLPSAIQAAIARTSNDHGGSVRHMLVDVNTKNRFGRTDELWQFYLTENGWIFPEKAIKFGEDKENVFWVKGQHTSAFVQSKSQEVAKMLAAKAEEKANKPKTEPKSEPKAKAPKSAKAKPTKKTASKSKPKPKKKAAAKKAPVKTKPKKAKAKDTKAAPKGKNPTRSKGTKKR